MGSEMCIRDSAQAPEWPLWLRTGVESQPWSSMLHRGGDMAMQGLTCRTPPAAFWLDSHQSKQTMHDSYDVLRPPMLDSMPSRPTVDLGLAADTSPETLPGDGVRVVRREGGCSGGLGPPETHRATTIRALVTSVRPRSSHVMMACVDRYIQRYIWGTPSCSSASTFDDRDLDSGRTPWWRRATVKVASPRVEALERERAPRRVTSGV